MAFRQQTTNYCNAIQSPTNLQLLPRSSRLERFRIEIDERTRVNDGNEEAESVDADVGAVGGDGVAELVQNAAHEKGEQVITELVPW